MTNRKSVEPEPGVEPPKLRPQTKKKRTLRALWGALFHGWSP